MSQPTLPRPTGAAGQLLRRPLDDLACDVTAATAQLRAHLQHQPAATLPDEQSLKRLLAYEIAHLTTWHNTYTDLERSLADQVLLSDADPRTVRLLRQAMALIATGLNQALDGVIAADAAFDNTPQ
ncbi:hypothetical protein AB0M43_14605 [Longispora sp. NPDC051575]|uniref:hypothetical protein n=1 Tax=Longispora sp. NPDC051575 TaxID=3154943 RepID=UPI0034387F17